MIRCLLKLRMVVLISLLLKGISSYASLSSLQNSSLNSDDLETISLLPEKTIHPEYQILLNTAKAYHGFCEDNYQFFKKCSAYKKDCEYRYVENIKSSEKIITLIEDIDQDKINKIVVLNRFLKMRLELISERGERYLKTKKHFDQYKTLPDRYFIPTNPESLSHLSLIDQEVARGIINCYQSINLIIYHLYKMQDPISLPTKTKQLISCSRTLWPILNDETIELSHPDFAFITYDDDPDDLKDHKDCDYYLSNFKHKELVGKKVTLMNWCRKETVIYLLQPLLKKNEYAIPLPKPSWLYPASNIEEPLLAGTVLKEDFLPLMPSLARKRKTKINENINSQKEFSNIVKTEKAIKGKKLKNKDSFKEGFIKEDNESDEKDKKLPTSSQEMRLTSKISHQNPLPISNLSKDIPESQIEGQNTNTSFSIEAAVKKVETLSIKTPEESKNTDLLVGNLSLSNNKAEEEGKMEDNSTMVWTPSQHELQKQFLHNPSSTLHATKNISDLQKINQNNNTLFSPETTNSSKNNTFLRSRGMRVFHADMVPQISETESILNKIDNKASYLIGIIFNPKMKGQGFTFGEFKNLWERLNGEGRVRSSGNGGSHYALLNSSNRVVGGTFAHGEGHQYTRNTVRYLRDALNMIGIFP
jgi:hypothetical protein